jgi:hypothetical protein
MEKQSMFLKFNEIIYISGKELWKSKACSSNSMKSYIYQVKNYGKAKHALQIP